MFRKAIIAVAAVATIGAAALVPTEASAHYRYFSRVIVPTAVIVTAATVAPACYWRYGWYRGLYVKRWSCY